MRRLVLLGLGALALPSAAQTGAPPTVVDAAAFGVTADAHRNHRSGLQQAIDRASYQRAPGQIARVVLPCHAPFQASGEAIGYAGSLVLRDSVLLVGCGGTELARAVDDRGTAYRPVREVAEPTDARPSGARETRLRLVDDALDRRDRSGRIQVTRINAAPQVAWVGAVDMVFDGNAAGNLDAYRRTPESQREDQFRNGAGWSGPMISNQSLPGDAPVRCLPGAPAPARPGRGARRRPIAPEPGAFGHFTRVAVVGYGATGIVGHECARFVLDTVLVGDVLYNHALYNADGVWRNVTVRGYAWTAVISQYGTQAENLVYERAALNPIGRRNPDLVNVRGGALTIRGMYADTRLPLGTGDGTGAGTGAGVVRQDDAAMLFSVASTASLDVDSLVWRPRNGLALGIGGRQTRYRNVTVAPERSLAFVLGGYYGNRAPTADHHVDVDGLTVVTPAGGWAGGRPSMYADRSTAGRVRQRWRRVEASGIAPLGSGGQALDRFEGQPRRGGYVAITESQIGLAGNHLWSDGRGGYDAPAWICADAATAASMGVALHAPADAACLAALRDEPVPPPGPTSTPPR